MKPVAPVVEVRVDEVYRQLQREDTIAYERSLEAVIAMRSRVSPRRWLDTYRLRRTRRELVELRHAPQ